MKISICQFDLKWGDTRANQEEAVRNIAACPPSDLYVLPEMWSTGFAVTPEGMAEHCNDAQGAYCSSLQWMMRQAEQHHAAIAGSIAVEEGGRYFNRFYFAKPDGTFAAYNKRHLFTYGGEDRRYSKGQQRVITEWMGLRICLQVCYDLRFPVWMRNRGDYDLLLFVANWPESRREPWDILVRARAIENQCYVAAVNRVGTDPSCVYSGGSVIVDAYGHIMASCRDGETSSATAETDLSALQAFRKKFPVLTDGDAFSLEQ